MNAPPPWLLVPGSAPDSASAPAPAQHPLAVALSGRSPGQVAPEGGAVASSRDLADELVSVLDAAGFPKAIVIGLSFGGQRAQALLQHRAERVAGLVLVASGAPDRARARALARRRWLWCLLPKAARLRRQRLLASDLDGAAQAEAFATFHGGVAVIELGADAVIAPAEAARVRSLFPQSRIARVPALTHDAVTSAPPELLAAVLAALDSLQNR